MTTDATREGPQETTSEDLARWERYGRLVVSVINGRSRIVWSAQEGRYVRQFERGAFEALDALADLMREHRRLANALDGDTSTLGETIVERRTKLRKAWLP